MATTTARLAWVTLRLTPGVTAAACWRLVERFGGPESVLAASPRSLVAAGVDPSTARTIAAGAARVAALRELERVVTVGARIVVGEDPEYPALLREIHDPPPCLYVRGTLDVPGRVAVAVVGARAASAYGRECAERLGADLAAAGVTVVSGLAYGVDAAAHRGALAVGGRTIAVLGSGVDVVYPREHGPLAAAVSESGALVSEFPLRTPPRAAHFPQRNRIIAGLVRAVVVVEATERSGSLITARCALEEGRDVLAVPGLVTAPRSRGTHLLIRDGAVLVTGAIDVMAEIGVDPRGEVDGAHVSPRETVPAGSRVVAAAMRTAAAGVSHADPVFTQLMRALGDGIDDVGGLAERTGLAAPMLLRMLLELELSGVVRALPGGGYALRAS